LYLVQDISIQRLTHSTINYARIKKLIIIHWILANAMKKKKISQDEIGSAISGISGYPENDSGTSWKGKIVDY